MSITVITTGGTIDKEYNPLDGKLEFPDTHIPEILREGNVQIQMEFKFIPPKDSLDMTNADRELISDLCKMSEDDKIIITHGTDTMCETAKIIGENKFNKTIIFVGAMVPTTVSKSDADFNLGFALAAVQTLSNGTYVCMNGEIFEWDKVHKNKEKGIFESN